MVTVTFISYKYEFGKLLQNIIVRDDVHARWLNTLSFLENCGARRIASCEHPTKVNREMLKHASEEFRHAYYLKQQISKLSGSFLPDYRLDSLLGGTLSRNYLGSLDVAICRYLKKEKKLAGNALKEMAYLLVTYAIERRASELYPLYQQVLKEKKSPISVKSILLEEDQHLVEIEGELAVFPEGQKLCEPACMVESDLCRKWLCAIESESRIA
jgi:hypothetical protein